MRGKNKGVERSNRQECLMSKKKALRCCLLANISHQFIPGAPAGVYLSGLQHCSCCSHCYCYCCCRSFPQHTHYITSLSIHSTPSPPLPSDPFPVHTAHLLATHFTRVLHFHLYLYPSTYLPPVRCIPLPVILLDISVDWTSPHFSIFQ